MAYLELDSEYAIKNMDRGKEVFADRKYVSLDDPFMEQGQQAG